MNKRKEGFEGLPLELVKEAPVGIFLCDEKGNFLYINKTFALIFGFKDAKELKDSCQSLYHLLGPIEFNRVWEKLRAHHQVHALEFFIEKKGGEPLWLCLTAKVISIRFQRLVEGFITDITEKKETAQLLERTQLQWRMLIEQAGDAFFIHDYEGRILEVNQRACDTLGYSREELLKMTIDDIDIEAQKKKHKTVFWSRLNPGQYVTFEGIHKRKDGSTYPVEVTLGRVDFGGKSLLLSITRDISKRKAVENELKRAYEEIKKLKERLELENIYLREEIETRFSNNEFIGESPAIKRVLKLAEKVAKEDTCVLIIGETGTGKELLARLIHNMSPRKERPMIVVNCAALPPTLIEAELFGVEKGAYTGAIKSRTGRFEAANGSTLFLDEIGELPLELQAKLLRVLEQKEFERIGSSRTLSVDVRIIAATNQDLTQLVREKRFRADLYFRLSVFPIYIPPLRERKEDIPLLIWHFVNLFNRTMGKRIVHIPESTIKKLMDYPWPGNVRELRNVIERAMILSEGTTLTVEDLTSSETSQQQSDLLNLSQVEKEHILRVLTQTNWKVSGKGGAAEILGLKESTLRAKMKKLGIRRPSSRNT